MGTAHGAEELGLCSYRHACQAGAWDRHHRVMPRPQQVDLWVRVGGAPPPHIHTYILQDQASPCILVQAYLFTQACSFLRLFRHNFAENGPQDLKMV